MTCHQPIQRGALYKTWSVLDNKEVSSFLQLSYTLRKITLHEHGDSPSNKCCQKVHVETTLPACLIHSQSVILFIEARYMWRRQIGWFPWSLFDQFSTK